MPNILILKRYLLLHVFVLVSMYGCVFLCNFVFSFVCIVFNLHDSNDFSTSRIPKFHRLHHRSYASGIQAIEMEMTLSQVKVTAN